MSRPDDAALDAAATALNDALRPAILAFYRFARAADDETTGVSGTRITGVATLALITAVSAGRSAMWSYNIDSVELVAVPKTSTAAETVAGHLRSPRMVRYGGTTLT